MPAIYNAVSAACLTCLCVWLSVASIQKVCARYKHSFEKLRAAPAPSTPEARLAYTHLLESVYDVHSSTLVYIAKGLHEIRTASAESREVTPDSTGTTCAAYGVLPSKGKTSSVVVP